MALREDLKQNVIVGLYDRGKDLDPSRQIISIGNPKILKSGIWSPYLINMRPALSTDTKSPVPLPHQRRAKTLLLDAMAAELDCLEQEGLDFSHVFGLPEAGTPLASAVSGVSGHSLLWQRVIPKEGYGSHQDLEGVHYPSQQVIEIDDVVTTGETKNEGVKYLANYGLTVPGVVIAFDREQGGRQAVEERGMVLRAAFGVTAVFGYLRDAGRISSSVYDYLTDYTRGVPPTEEPHRHPWS
jgi:orotate phosphoribosyltransferase